MMKAASVMLAVTDEGTRHRTHSDRFRQKPWRDCSDASRNDAVYLDCQDRFKTSRTCCRVKVRQEKLANPLPDNVPYERAWWLPIRVRQ